MGKRIEILLTAEKILAKRGLYGLSMKYLADTAGIAAGTIYRYFTNKEALMVELYQYIRQEAAITIFTGWSEQQSNHEKYNLLWRNIFNAVLSNPQRLAVVEMLYYLPSECRDKLDLFDGEAFQPLEQLYQKGIDNKELKNWPIPVLMALSLDSSISLAKKVLRDNIEINEQLIQQACEASWTTITN
jgi:TetR/AcrR family transcriptional repressor of multidrug resistance operon